MQIGLGPIFAPVSPRANEISHLFTVALIICAFIFAIVLGTVGYCVLRCRAKPGDPEPRQIMGSRKLEILWTVIPLAIVLFTLCLSTRVLAKLETPPQQKPDLILTGHLWWWEARYTSNGVHTANEIHIPIGQPLLVRIESADVLHDFWAPQLGRKIHAVPGHPNDIWLEADNAGVYQGECAEFCGTQHAWMRFLVIAETPDEFAAWSRRQLQPLALNDNAASIRGRKVFQQYSCANCHALSGVDTNATAGPNLTSLGSRRTLGAGILANTPENLERWLADPQAIKPGCQMPNFLLTSQQAKDLADFLEPSK